MVYQFTVHSNLPANSACPIHPMFQLYGKLLKGEKITPKEKTLIADRLYGVGGSCSSTFKLMGFAANFSRVLPRILVKQYGSWNEYYAPNKTSLRKALYGKIDEIVEA